VQAGDIVVLSGIEDVLIGDTICQADREGKTPAPLPRLRVDEPTVAMSIGINTSPLVGREGRYVQSRNIRERLLKETLRNVSIVVEDDPEQDRLEVKGRGELQLAILIETMRREGFELSVGRTRVILKQEGGRTLEPLEQVFVDCPNEHQGIVTEKLLARRGSLEAMKPGLYDRVRLEFVVPSRGLIGYRDEFLTDTRGQGVLHRLVVGYGPFRGEFESRRSGSLVADRAGKGVAYGLYHLQPRGKLFIRPNDVVYEGMIVGEHNRGNDLNVNACREKKLTNLRAAGKDENIILSPVQPPNLEQALQFIRDDERVEVTPKSVRMRKQILPAVLRKGFGSRM
jgi:GTP-binding protein